MSDTPAPSQQPYPNPPAASYSHSPPRQRSLIGPALCLLGSALVLSASILAAGLMAWHPWEKPETPSIFDHSTYSTPEWEPDKVNCYRYVTGGLSCVWVPPR